VRASAIPPARLRNQRLSVSDFTTPQEAVKWLGAVQAQDFEGAKWAVAQRVRRATNDDIEKAFADGSILRTHVLRPTWHFATPDDLHWMLQLTAPRIASAMAGYCRKYSLDEAAFRRSNRALAAALREAAQLTREEMRHVLRRERLAPDGVRMAFMLLRAELDAVICSGPRVGRQFTYALFERRVPQTRSLSRAQALEELTRRYFTSRGPATAHDFAWWSGLTVADARLGIEMAGNALHREDVDGIPYWVAEPIPSSRTDRGAYLLPPYDEYLIAYRDRSAALHPSYSRKGIKSQFTSTIVVGGHVVGTWQRTVTPQAAVVTLRPFEKLTIAEQRAVGGAVRRYGQFVGRRTAVEN
jgi:hypothetical protein